MLEETNEPLLGQTNGVLVLYTCSDARNSAQQLDYATNPDVNMAETDLKCVKVHQANVTVISVCRLIIIPLLRGTTWGGPLWGPLWVHY